MPSAGERRAAAWRAPAASRVAPRALVDCRRRALPFRRSAGTISSLKRPAVDRRQRLLVRCEGEGVRLLAVDAVLLRHQLRGQAHARGSVGIALEQRRVGRDACAPPIGIRLIDSVPPADRHLGAAAARPRPRRAAIACSPEEQKRLTVMAAARVREARPAGSRCAPRSCPARPRAWRSPGSRRPPCPASSAGDARERALDGGSPPCRRAASARRVPRPALPTAVRTLLTITASRMSLPGSLVLVPQRLAFLSSMCWMRARVFGRAEQRQEGLALEVEEVLLADRARRAVAAAQDGGELRSRPARRAR